MRHRSRAVGAIGGVALALVAAQASVAAIAPTPGEGISVTVALSHLRSTRGLIRACLTAQPRTFPDCDRDPQALHQSVAAHDGPVLVFRHVQPGTYAVSLFHDENGDNRLDKVVMIPTEGFGFSRDAPVRFGPPRFADAAVAVGGSDIVLPVRVRYLL